MKEQYKKCPECGIISGFYLEEKQNKNEEFFCQECGRDSKLKDWKDSIRVSYIKQINSD